MRQYRTEQLRNFSVIGHSGAGKSQLIEALLYKARAVDRLAQVDAGNGATDYDVDEQARQTTIDVKLLVAENRGTKLNILDTPGYEDFYGDLESGLRVSDASIAVVDAASGVEGGTEKVWDRSEKHEIPRAVFIGKMDKENANFDEAFGSLSEILEGRFVSLHIPIGAAANFEGVVDLITMKAVTKDGVGDIPADLQSQAEEAREALIETAAEADDALIEKYFEEGTLSDEELTAGLKVGIQQKLFVPVLAGSSLTGIGVDFLLKFIVDMLPSPTDARPIALVDSEEILSADPDAPMAALVYKTMGSQFGNLTLFRVYSGTLTTDTQVLNPTRQANERIAKIAAMNGNKQSDVDQVVAGDFGVLAKMGNTGTGDTLCSADKALVLTPIDFPKPVIPFSAKPKREGDDEKINSGFLRMAEEDPTFVVNRDARTKETIITGMGEMHVNVILQRIARRFNAEAELGTPRVSYLETVKRSAQGVQGRHKKQSGGRGQFGEVWIHLDPLPHGQEDPLEFVNKVVGGSIPRNYIPAVEKGIRGAMEEGVLANCPVVDVQVTLYDGKYHAVDSSDLAFSIAGSQAFKAALQQARPVLLEPIMDVTIMIPDQNTGDIIGDLNSRRGRVMGVDQTGKRQAVKAQVPLAEMFRYSIDLKSMTSARGSFTMEFSRYEEVPDEVAAKVIPQLKADQEEE